MFGYQVLKSGLFFLKKQSHLLCASPWSKNANYCTVQEVRDHQVDSFDVEPPTVTRTPTRTTVAERTQTTSPGRSENIVNTGNTDSSEHKPAGEEAKGIEKNVDKTPQPGAQKKKHSKSGSSERPSSEECPMMASSSPSGRFGVWLC